MDPMPGHGDHGSRPMCAMNMALNWDTDNVCILFDFWRITSTTSLVLSCAAVFVLGYLYELSRARVRFWELATYSNGSAARAQLETPLVTADGFDKRARWMRALLYGLLVAYSYSLMLIFMTYNGFLILAVIGGAVVGHYKFSTDTPGAVRGANCH
ncbi:copper transpport protein [Coemansia sp. RSA 989]|nr:Ctr copper transporter family-domain-containing protein [Coemansia mojavensis]KAJ1743286.1 copper transpport protein [Coemansia sp. RSA 1086]KAJ1752999.1 copper transpport protein [Coemansia sp. RSA 1821]KAJ1866664.1 copper transpport protein [Coemansia sp. RSA 989]KAJ1875513.1 copper transpport protein [Coemansia sp. RSA 990]KAJ2630305.1 copper transpport protein [Coemansia sp. RSA 1290]KAJ2651951.1 copper transpport protein [Coemansia sp. RSA 1250]KAJ2674978.1 copper transpport protein 